MVQGVDQASMNRNFAVLCGPRLPWAVAGTIAIAAEVIFSLLHARGIVGQRASSSANIFFGTLAAGFVPRALPGIVQLRLDVLGLTVRNAFRSYYVPWLDVLGPFTVTTNAVGTGVTFTRRNRAGIGSAYQRITLYNTYGLPEQALADMLNTWRAKCLELKDTEPAADKE